MPPEAGVPLTKLILIMVCLAPFTSFAHSANYNSTFCESGVFNLATPDDEAIRKFVLGEAFAYAAQFRYAADSVQFSDNVAELGGFHEDTLKTIKRRLYLQGFADTNSLNVQDLNDRAARLTVGDIYAMLKQEWTQTYCR